MKKQFFCFTIFIILILKNIIISQDLFFTNNNQNLSIDNSILSNFDNNLLNGNYNNTNNYLSNNLGLEIINNNLLNILKNPITNTIIITNIKLYNDFTNYEVTNTNIIFIFYDPFYELLNLEENDFLFISFIDLLFPAKSIFFTNDVANWLKKYKIKKGLELIDDYYLFKFNELSFQKYLQRKLTGRLELTEQEKESLTIGFEQWETKILVNGWVDLRASYGLIFKDETFYQGLPGINSGFMMNQSMRMNLVGKIGERINVKVNFSSESQENEYDFGYFALPTDTGILKELRFGNIALNIPLSSKYLTYSGINKDSYGAKVVFEWNNFTLQSIISFTGTKKGYRKFTGKKRQEIIRIYDVGYIKRKYFVLPDKNIDSDSIELLISTSDSINYNRIVNSKYYKRLVIGKDYYINLETGELTLIKPISRDNDLIVHYRISNNIFSTNSNITIGIDTNDNKIFLYLWSSTANFSPYMHYGYYSIGYQNFDLNRGFSIDVLNPDGSYSEFQFKPSDYEINTLNGIIKFKKQLPFPDINKKLYTNASDPNISDSYYQMRITLNYPVSSYQLDFGIVPGTEQVYVNGRLLSSREYTMIHSIGELFFYNSSIINENDTIEVYYEYKPFYTGSQKLGLAARLDWKPSNLLNIGSTILYNIAQRDQYAPNIYITPGASFLANLDFNANIGKIFNLPDYFEFLIKGEYALSSLDMNTYGYAIIEDFENIGDIFRTSKNESLWVLCAPTTNIYGIYYTNRGKLLYKDYRNYNFDGSFNLIHFSSKLETNKIKEYSFKPGPYLAFGGHLPVSQYPNVSQTSLIFDFDFSDGIWVGAAYNLSGPSGINFSEYNEITIWAKLESDTNSDNIFEDEHSNAVELYLVLGKFNEDSDGDGIFDYELDRAQNGYEFNNFLNKTVVDTYVGRGRLGGGDNYIQSEDLNRDNSFNTNENVIVFPSILGNTDITNILIQGGGWKKITINIRYLTKEQIEILEHVTAFGIYIKKHTGNKGRLIIDSIDFKKVNWQETKIDNIQVNNQNIFKGEVLSVYGNDFYATYKFYNPLSTNSYDIKRTLVFEKLHGQKNITEAQQINEKALAIVYNFSNTTINTNVFPFSGGSAGILVKRFLYPIDLSLYKILQFYLFVPDKDENGNLIKSTIDTESNENIIFLVGNNDNNYYKWKIPIYYLNKNKWNEVKIYINENLSIEIDGNKLSNVINNPESSGIPVINDIKFMAIGAEIINTNEPYNKGTFWVNEIFVLDDNFIWGNSYYLTTSLNYKKPVLKLWDIEFIGPINFSGTFENKDYNFVPSEGTKREKYFNNLNLNLGMNLFKYLGFTYSINYKLEGTPTNNIILPEYYQWNYNINNINFALTYNMNKDYIPSINHSYTENFETKISKNLMESFITNNYISIFEINKFNNSITFNINQNIPIMQGFSIFPNFSFSDFYEIFDSSNFTNQNNSYYFTNDNVYGMENLKKVLSTGIRFYLWQVNLSGNYSKTKENFLKINDLNGFRNNILELNEKSFFERYFDRIDNALKGFYYSNKQLEKQDSETYNINLSTDRLYKIVSFSISDNLTKELSGRNYDTIGNLISKSDKYNMASDFSLNIYPNTLNINTILFKLNRNFELSYLSTSTNVELTNLIFETSEIFYQHPLYYNILLTGNYGRSNSLNLTSKFSDSAFSSLFNFSERLNIELVLNPIKGFLGSFIPTRYYFYTLLNSDRKVNSYSQKLENYFESSIQLKYSELNFGPFDRNAVNRIGDMNIGFKYKNNINYNDKTINNFYTISINQPIFISNYANVQLSYNLTINSVDYITNIENIDFIYGLTVPPPSESPKTTLYHNANLVFNWEIRDFTELDLIFFKINLRGSTLNNRETLNFTAENIFIDGYNFSRFIQKLFEISYEHYSSYKFTDYITGGLNLKTVLNSYAEVSPLGNDKKISYFKPGFGIMGSIDLRIKF